MHRSGVSPTEQPWPGTPRAPALLSPAGQGCKARTDTSAWHLLRHRLWFLHVGTRASQEHHAAAEMQLLQSVSPLTWAQGTQCGDYTCEEHFLGVEGLTEPGQTSGLLLSALRYQRGSFKTRREAISSDERFSSLLAPHAVRAALLSPRSGPHPAQSPRAVHSGSSRISQATQLRGRLFPVTLLLGMEFHCFVL